MEDSNKRRHERRVYKAQVGLMMAAGTLEGETINISRGGALIRASGHIVIVLNLDGREYRGRLVRATPIDADTVAYAVQLMDEID